MILPCSGRVCLAIAGLAGLAGVGLDALGAHALGPAPDPARKALLDLATRYLLVHAVAMLGLAAVLGQTETRAAPWLRLAAWAFASGMVLFCGGLAARAIGEVALLAPLVPVGGTALLVGWAALLGHAVVPARR